jgi:hypothetical protein
MQTLKAQQAEAEKKLTDATAILQDNATKWPQWESNYQSALRAKEQAEAKLAAVNARLDSLKQQGYVSDEQLAGLDVRTPAPTSTGAGNGSGAGTGAGASSPQYLTREDFKKELGVGGKAIAKLNARIVMMANEHQKLFQGTDKAAFDPDSLIEHIDQHGGTLEQAWETKYGVSARRQELDKTAREQEIERRAEEKFKQRVSQEIQAGHHNVIPPAPSNVTRIAAAPGALPQKTPAQRRFERINKAVAELESQRAGAQT